MRFLFLCFLAVCVHQPAPAPAPQQGQQVGHETSPPPGQTVHGGGAGIGAPTTNGNRTD